MFGSKIVSKTPLYEYKYEDKICDRGWVFFWSMGYETSEIYPTKMLWFYVSILQECNLEWHMIYDMGHI